MAIQDERRRGLGGQWGGADDGRQAYFSVNGPAKTPGGMRAVNLDTGAEVWSKKPPKSCAARSADAAPRRAPRSPRFRASSSRLRDGGLRAYASDDGTIVWPFNTNREFQTVNGVKAKGGAMDGPGAAVVDGMVYVNSGYGSLIGRPGNVLLAFGVD